MSRLFAAINRRPMRVLVVPLCLAALSLPVAASFAQAPTNTPITPLFISISGGQRNNEGDLWVYKGGLNRRTRYGHNDIPIVSPDGQWMAYASTAEFFVKARTEDTPLVSPRNIWILNTSTSETRRLVAQPDNASIENGKSVYILRSAPGWSPSGRQLTWTQIVVNDAAGETMTTAAEQLIIYDLDVQREIVMVPKLPDHGSVADIPLLSEVAWGYPGIAVAINRPGGALAISVYDTDGTLKARTDEMTHSDYQYTQMIWIHDERADKYYVTNVQGLSGIDPESGEDVTLGGTPELYSPSNPFGISLYYGDKTVGEGNPVWLIALNGQPVDELASAGRYYYQSGIAISGDGQRAAYIVYPGQGTTGGTYIYRNGSKIRLDTGNVTGVAWGAVAWRIHYDNPEGAG